MATKKRTTLRSTKDKKLYAERGTQGEFEDIQTFKRAHGQDIKRVSKAETASSKKNRLARDKKRLVAKKK
jgi:hypothetical protein